ncbi:hypothetical protein MUN81_15355 [Hymenobacter sp. 5317J-9]|uniref:hypothetical protein n=1 Tax=Hymenobacter sp. 5317J-9 TaxID=2932250 RepID=UPI001FD665F8|nr:hypothetical protein [Hymenobacter sp. 5317J-9]UOQ96612.1 hypothetical protein MUN81_15355 [Hymenobacter sp. 5317J-9]
MPQIQLKTVHDGGVSFIWLYSPLPGRQLYEVRNTLLRTEGVRVIWQGKLASVKEYQALHWVEPQHNANGGTGIGYRDYQVLQGSGFEGYRSAVESLYSAVVAMLPKGAAVGDAEVIVARQLK